MMQQKGDTFGSFTNAYEGKNAIGGSYDSLRLQGVVTGKEDVQVSKDFHLRGTLEGRGLQAESIEIEGTARLTSLGAKKLEFDGQVSADDVKIESTSGKGSLSLKSLEGKALVNQGITRIGSVKASDTVQNVGTLLVDTIQANDLSVHGAINAQELTVQTVHIVLEGKEVSKVDKIRARICHVEAKHAEARLSVSSLEAERVEIANTDVVSIKAKQVTVGTGCTIEEVIYEDSLKVAEGATVKRSSKL